MSQFQDRWIRYKKIPTIESLIKKFENQKSILDKWKSVGSGTIRSYEGTINISSAISNLEQELENTSLVIDERIANYESTKSANLIARITILISVLSAVAAVSYIFLEAVMRFAL